MPIRLIVGGESFEMEALLDTGFDGAVIVPSTSIPSGVHDVGTGTWQPADGSTVRARRYHGMIRVGELEPFRAVIYALGGETLIGRLVSDRFLMTLDHGRRVIVEP